MSLILPCPIFNYEPNHRMIYSIFFSQFRARIFPRSILTSNFNNLLSRKFARLECRFFSSFFNHVLRIFFKCSKKQMRWVNTRRIITFMAHNLIRRNFTDHQRPSNSMGSKRFSMCSNVSVATTSAGLPLPTITRSFLINFTPKSLTKFHHKFLSQNLISRTLYV